MVLEYLIFSYDTVRIASSTLIVDHGRIVGVPSCVQFLNQDLKKGYLQYDPLKGRFFTSIYDFHEPRVDFADPANQELCDRANYINDEMSSLYTVLIQMGKTTFVQPEKVQSITQSLTRVLGESID